MNKAGYIFCVLSLLASVALIGVTMPYAMVSESVASAGLQCRSLDEDIEIELSGVLEGVSMYDLLSNYLENPPAQKAGAASVIKQFGGC